MTWSHDSLEADLFRFLLGKSDRMFWRNVPMGPSGSVRPDIYSLAKSYNPRPLSYEVKVSVADYRRDVTAGKWQAYLDYSAGVIFAAPKGMVAKADLPPGCGLMVRSETGWRTVKAPPLGKVMLPQDLLLKLLMDRPSLRSEDRPREFVMEWEARHRAVSGIGRTFGRCAGIYAQNHEEAERNLHKLKEDHESTLNKARADAEKIREESAHLLREIAEAFGLPKTVSARDLTWRIKGRLKRLREDGEATELRQAVERLVAEFDRIRQLPLIKPETEATA